MDREGGKVGVSEYGVSECGVSEYGILRRGKKEFAEIGFRVSGETAN